MGAFEYLSVLISIVLGLGITHLLTGFGRWLEHRESFRPYGPALAWALFVLLAHIQTWWTMFGLRSYGEWNFLQFTVVLLQPILLFLLAQMAFPGPDAPRRDLRENFLHHRRWFFGLLALLLLVSLLKDVVRAGRLPGPANLAFHAVFIALAAVGGTVRSERAQRPIAYGSLAVLVVYVVALFFQL